MTPFCSIQMFTQDALMSVWWLSILRASWCRQESEQPGSGPRLLNGLDCTSLDDSPQEVGLQGSGFLLFYSRLGPAKLQDPKLDHRALACELRLWPIAYLFLILLTRSKNQWLWMHKMSVLVVEIVHVFILTLFDWSISILWTSTSSIWGQKFLLYCGSQYLEPRHKIC